jgi:hypothetical protein
MTLLHITISPLQIQVGYSKIFWKRFHPRSQCERHEPHKQTESDMQGYDGQSN